MKNFKSKRFVTFFILAVAIIAALPAMTMAQRNYGRGNNYDRRTLKNSVNDLKRRSERLTSHIDSYLDRSIYNGSNREDQVNEIAREFRSAADRLKDNLHDANQSDLDRTSGDARSVIDLGQRLESFFSRYNNRVDSRIRNDWSGIRQDLQVISRAYGNGGFGNGRDSNRNRRRFFRF
ncbi:MAG: hypothetical protein ACRD4L_11760 [Pyrinomonadaceae bacterium]